MDKLNPRETEKIQEVYLSIVSEGLHPGMKGKTAKGTIEVVDVSGNEIIIKDEKGKEKVVNAVKLEKQVKKWLKEEIDILNEETYKEFFTKKLKKFGVDEPDKLPDDKKKQFYDEVDKGWKGKKEKPEKNESKLDESSGSRLHGVFGDLFDYLENDFFGMASGMAEKQGINIKKLTQATDKLYKLWQKELKGKGLIGW